MQPHGRLLLVPTPLDFGMKQQVALTDVLPQGTIVAAASLSHWVCENAKTLRSFLRRVAELHPLATPLQQQHVAEFPREVHKKGDHAGAFDAKPLLAAALQGHDVGLASEAGMPGIADPGASVARAAHELGLQVVPLTGPGSIFLALAASGLGGQNFAFVGYLPQEAAMRAQRLRELEKAALQQGQTQLFIETPYRNLAMWQSLMQALQPQTRVAVACGITLPDARCRCDTVKGWKTLAPPLDNDTPAVFALGR